MTAFTVRVGSQNPVKVEAVRLGFAAIFPNAVLNITGVSVPSGVAAQPIGDDETLTGARNRAQAAHAAARDDTTPPTHTVGIEGGCALDEGNRLTVFAWVAVYEVASDRWGHSKTATFTLPREVAELVRGGVELGEADDIVFGQENSKQANGSVGLLTGDAVTRTTYYTQAVTLALIPFANPRLTFD